MQRATFTQPHVVLRFVLAFSIRNTSRLEDASQSCGDNMWLVILLQNPWSRCESLFLGVTWYQVR
jgi:hypothetical protein